MDIAKMIKDSVEKITKDPALMNNFKTNPVKAVESVLGVDLPDDVINQVIEGVKAKINIDKAGDLLGSIKKLF